MFFPGPRLRSSSSGSWLPLDGGEQRSTRTTGLLLMGVRLYNPVTGQFTSADPVPGAGATVYATDPATCSPGGQVELTRLCGHLVAAA